MANVRAILSLLLVVVCLCLATAGQVEASGRGYVAMADCEGHLLRVSLDGLHISRDSIWRIGGLNLPRPADFDGCVVADFKGDSESGIGYLVISRDFSYAERRHYIVVAFDLETLQQIASRSLDDAIAGSVHLLLSPSAREVRISYSSFEGDERGGGWRNIVKVYEGNGLKPTWTGETFRPYTSDAESPKSFALSGEVHWLNSDTLIERNFILDKQGQVLQRIDPYNLVDSSIGISLGSFKKKGYRGIEFIPVAFADSVSSKVAFVVGDDFIGGSGRQENALLLYDIIGRRVMPPIIVGDRVAAYDPTAPETPTVHLTPDGQSILVEQFEPRGVGSEMVRFKTGVINIYNVNGGSLKRTLCLAPAPGASSRLIGISLDGKVAIIGSMKDIYVVSLEGEAKALVIHSEGDFNGFLSKAAVFVNPR